MTRELAAVADLLAALAPVDDAPRILAAERALAALDAVAVEFPGDQRLVDSIAAARTDLLAVLNGFGRELGLVD